jgi:hypothetical protein
MPKRPVSVTLDEDNLLWLRGRMARRKRRSLSDALDEVISAARASGTLDAPRSVVGTIGLPDDDPGLESTDAYTRALFAQSLSRPLLVHEQPSVYPAPSRRPRKRTAGPARRRG